MEPIVDVLNERLGKSFVSYLQKRGGIQFKPLEFMRGKTFENCLYIMDEAQNCTESQMKLFLTRIGEDCIVVVNGDLEQKDIREKSGLLDAMQRLQHVDGVGIVEFDMNDCVRSGMALEILKAYR
jgi:phosphate starvation-inducible PhoH-like protein